MKTKIIVSNIQDAAELIKSGELVAVPTETVYGLAGNGLDIKAVEAIYEVKGRPEVKPLSLMVHGAEDIEKYCEDVPRQAYVLAGKYWPGPLTIVLKAKSVVPEITIAGGKTVGLRCPMHEKTLELLEKCCLPLAAPSANISGCPSPKTARAVLDYFDGKISAVIDGGECSLGTESTIIDMSSAPFRILRSGALESEDISQTLVENMTIIGITGGTGCGKTTALSVLKDMGACVIDCDAVYHELTECSCEMRQELCREFGDVYSGSVLDRKKLGAIVFADKNALLKLNEITHKYVRLEVYRRLREHALNGGRVAAIDAIALLEGELKKLCSVKVGVLAPVEDRIKRLLKRENISKEYARSRIAAQKSDSFYEEGCDHILKNDGDIREFEEKCRNLFTEVLKNERE